VNFYGSNVVLYRTRAQMRRAVKTMQTRR